jgi:3-oxoacid CoA-transferase subunit B
VVTELGLFRPAGKAFDLIEIAPGVGVDEVRAATGCPLNVPADIKRVAMV